MRVAYEPYKNTTNKYIEISQECIKSCGHEVIDFHNIWGIKKNYFDVAILNWYENLNGRNTIKVFLKDIIRRIWIIILKTQGVKIVFTFHNRRPHDMQGNINAKLRSDYMKWLIRKADRVIILSKDSVKYLPEYMDSDEVRKKISFIPHPNYIGVYTDNTTLQPLVKRDKFHVLFVGQVKHYKNIELLIKAAEKLTDLNLEIMIAGKPKSEAYADELKTSIKDLPNIHLNLTFIPNEEIDVLIQESDVLVLPYDIQSSMNSGTVFLAFSNGRTVICPLISSLKDFDENLYYSYMYTTEDDHVEKLEHEIRKAYTDWDTDIEKFEEKGKTLYKMVRKNNSKEMIIQCYMELFEKLEQQNAGK